MSEDRPVNKFSLSGKTAIVTGGGRGIGRAIVDALADAGANIAVAARKQGPLDAAVQTAQKKRAARESLFRFGDLHILVNNAGVQLLAPAEVLSEEIWDETLAANLKAPFF